MSAAPNNPTLVADSLSSIRTMGLKPYLVTGIFLQLLRMHFSQASNIFEPKLKKMLWVPSADDSLVMDPKLTQVLIQPVYDFNWQKMGATPAIIIKRNLIKSEKFTVGGKEHGDLAPSDYPAAGEHHVRMRTGSHTIFCVASAVSGGGKAELIATEVFDYLEGFASVFMCEFGFHDLKISGMDELSQAEEAVETFVVPINVEYAYEARWVVARQEPRLKGMSLNVEP